MKKSFQDLAGTNVNIIHLRFYWIVNLYQESISDFSRTTSPFISMLKTLLISFGSQSSKIVNKIDNKVADKTNSSSAGRLI